MAKIKAFKSNCKEISVDYNGYNYLIICGKHINGGYCAFPKLGVSSELCGYGGDTGYSYNNNKLLGAFEGCNDSYINEDTIKTLSKIITDTIQTLPDVLPF